jgi:hypothetical protein
VITGSALSYVKCLNWCVYHAGSIGGSFRFALRPSEPPQAAGFGQPCAFQSGALPIALVYDPFGIPGRQNLEALLTTTTSFKNRFVLLWLGTSDQRIGSLPLPFDLTTLGAPGCALLQDAVVLLSATTNTRDLATIPLADAATLRGLPPIYLQWMIPDPINALGLLFSNGVRLEVR